VGQGLALPLQSRVRILRELAFDLEELSADLMARGVPAEEARRRATEALVPEGPALAQLDRIHAPLYRRATRGVAPWRLRMMERGALAAGTALVLAGGSVALARVDVFGDPSAFLAPVLVVGALIFALVAAKAFELFVRGDHALPGRGLGAILGVSSLALGLGLGGTFFELLRLAGTLQSAPELAEVLVPAWLARTAVLLLVALLVALAGGLGWFVLSQWVALAEGAQREVLGLPGNHVTSARRYHGSPER